MKHCWIVIPALAALPAQAQIVTSHGTRLGYDCYMQARVGTDAARGLATCNQALSQERLSINDRAATFDNRGIIFDLLNRGAEAEADFDHAIALRPDLGDAYVNRGAMLIKRQRYGQALSEIEHGLGLG